MADDQDPLSEALRVYLRHRASPDCDDTELLARRPDLAELLEPLLEHDSVDRMEIAPGARLGDFRLIESIGRGGMGEVWEAEQFSLRRRVALKLLRGERFANLRALERFRREALAGARLRHPDIVAVFGVGEEAGLHFIAQELVETRRTLADFLQERRASPTAPGEYWREIAQLFARIAEALEAAHAAGVIHRDIKPSNILLTADGAPKVADFGIALIEGELELSRTGELTGSPFYMSPEQASARRRDLDVRSDVFSLGATLYEALTFVRPFDGDTITQVLSKILAEDPVDPRKLRSTCPLELAVICLKALEKERGRRFASMGDMAADLRRYLRHEPILARPIGAWTRGIKWSRRHPVRATSAAILILSGIALYVQLNRAVSAELDARRQTDIARSERRVADEQRALATRRLEEAERERTRAESQTLAAETARRASDEQRARAETKVAELAQINAFLVDVFAGADPARARGKEPTARDLLEYGAKTLESKLLDQPLVRASLYDSIGRTMLSLGSDERAQALLERALTLREEAAGTESLEAAETLQALASLDAKLSRPTALPRAREALELRLRHEKIASETTVGCYLAYANALMGRSRSSDAKEVLVRGLLYTDQLPIDARPSRAMLNATLSTAHRLADEYEESIAAADRALELRSALSDAPHPLVAAVLGDRASSLAALGRFEEAFRTFDEVLALEERLSGPNSQRFAAHLVNRSRVSRSMGDATAERDGLTRALDIFRSAATPTNSNALTCREMLTWSLINSGEFEAALKMSAEMTDALEQGGLANSRWALVARHLSSLASDGAGSPEVAIATAQDALTAFAGSTDFVVQERMLSIRCMLLHWRLRRGEMREFDPTWIEDIETARLVDLETPRSQWVAFARGCLHLSREEFAPAAEALEKLISRKRNANTIQWIAKAARLRLAEALANTDTERARSMASAAAAELGAYFGVDHADVRAARELVERLRDRGQ